MKMTQEIKNLLTVAASSEELSYEQVKELIVALTGGKLYAAYSDSYYDNTGYVWNEAVVLSAERAEEAVKTAEHVKLRNGKESPNPIVGYETLNII